MCDNIQESKLESEGQTQASQIATILKEMKELRFIVQTKLELESSSTREKTDIGRSSLEYLQKNHLISTFVPIEGESVLQREEFLKVQKMDEKELTELILSKLGEI